MKKRIFPLALALAVTASSIPATAFAADPETPDNDGTLTIAGHSIALSTAEDGGTPISVGNNTVYYKLLTAGDSLSDTKTLYGTSTLTYNEFYQGYETDVAQYDAITSPTTKFTSTFKNTYVTNITDSGYDIEGVTNVNVAVNEKTYVEAEILEAAQSLPESGLYAEAAAITLSEDTYTTAPAQYKTLTSSDNTDGYFYENTQENLAATVTDAELKVDTSRTWSDYVLAVEENSTKYLRNTKSDQYEDESGNKLDFAINSQIQGAIVTGTTADGETVNIGVRHMWELWVQPYEIGFDRTATSCPKLSNGQTYGPVYAYDLLKSGTVTKITYLMPDATYVYDFGKGAYVKDYLSEESSFSASFDGLTALNIDTSNMPADMGDVTVSVYAKAGRTTTYFAQNAAITNGKVTLTTPVEPKTTYTVTVSSSKYADFSQSVTSGEADFTGCTATLAATAYTYDGTAKTPAVTVKNGDDTLVVNEDYTVSYSNNVNAGTATVTITGINNYKGTITKTFRITGKALSSAQISAISDKVYTGKAIAPSVVVKDGTKTLKAGTDYTVSYKNNKNTGKATVTVTGKGNYAGTKTTTFKIVPKKAALSKKPVNKASKKMVIKWKKDAQADGYQIRYSTNKNFKKSVKTVTIKKKATTTKTISKLKKGKTYYVQVRSYKTIDGKKCCGAWSAKKSVKIKK